MTKYGKITSRLTATVLVVIFCLALLPSFANAQYDGASGFFDCVQNPIDCVLYYVRSFAAHLVALAGASVDIALKQPVAGIPVVRDSWNIVRGFSNMFFILILIIMAFSTIFSISKYDFRTLIVKFLIAALLINFSLVIGEIIIDWSTSLSNVFLQAIGDVGYRIAEGTNISANITFGSVPSNTGPSGIVNQDTWNNTMRAGLDIIMLGIVLFSLLVLLFFSIVRVPILWFLLIISPVAWITYILPTTQGINRQWWKEFIGWNVFMPIYLFFIYFGVLILGQQDQILTNASGPLVSGISTGFQTIFFYVLVGVFLIGGAKIARTASVAAGAGGIAAGIWAKGRATARWTGARVPFVPYKSGGRWYQGYGLASGRDVSGAYKEAKQYYGREGILGIGGTRQAEEKISRVSGAIGVSGVEERQLQKNIQSYEQKLNKPNIDEAQLKRIIDTSSNTEERIAAANVMKTRYRDLESGEVSNLYTGYKQLNQGEAAKWIRSQKSAIEGLSRDDLTGLEGIADPQMQQFIARIKAKRGFIPDVDEYKRKLGLFTNDAARAGFIGDSKDFVDSLKKDEALSLLSAIPSDSKEARKKFVGMVVEKGYFEENMLKSLTDENTGVFESVSEREKFLDLAKKTRLIDALSAKLSVIDRTGQPILRDLSTGNSSTVENVLEQEFNRMDVDAIASQKYDATAGTGLADSRVLAALEKSLTNSRPERINQFYRNTKYGSDVNLQKLIQPVINKARLNALKKDKEMPLKDTVQELLTSLIPAVELAKGLTDKTALESAIRKAESALDKAKRLSDSIVDNDFADDTTIETAKNLYSDAKDNLDRAKQNQPPPRNP